MISNTNQRAQTGELSRAQLQPVATPVDTFVTPGRVDPSQKLAALANTLSNVSPKLQGILQAEQERHKQRMLDLAEQRLAGLTYEEAQAHREAGTLAVENDPWHRAAIEQYYGSKRAAHMRESILDQINKGEINVLELGPDGVEKAVADAMAADIEELGAGSMAANAYTREAKNARDAILQQTNQFLRAEDKRISMEAAFKNFSDVVKQGVEKQLPPSEIHKLLRSQYEPTKSLYGLNWREQDELVMNLAEHLAGQPGGNYEVVKELLLGDRGNGLGSLGEKRSNITRAEGILGASRKAKLEDDQWNKFYTIERFNLQAMEGKLSEEELHAFREENPMVMSDKEIIALIEQNRRALRANREKLLNEDLKFKVAWQEQQIDQHLMHLINNGWLMQVRPQEYIKENGEIGEYSRDQLQKRATGLYMKYITQKMDKAVLDGDTAMAEAIFNDAVEKLSINGMEHPQWADELSRGYQAATVFTVGNEPAEMPQQLMRSLDLYERLHAANPRLAKAMTKDAQAIQFYEMYRLAKQFGRMEPNTAAALAMQATSDPAGFRSRHSQAQLEQIHLAVNNVIDQGWFKDDAENIGMLGSDIERLAQLYALTGVKIEKAVEQAAEAIIDGYVNVNGWLVPANDRTLPANFGKAATNFVRAASEARNIDPDEITLVPISSSQKHYMIVSKSGGLIPPASDGSKNLITFDDIMKFEQDRIKKKIEETSSRITEKAQSLGRALESEIISP